MSDQSQLERRYRRLLACFPAAFRSEHEDEMLVLLLACARDGRRCPGLADTADLVWHALRLRVAPMTRRSVPTVFWGVRLMLLAACLELVALVIVIATQGTVDAAVLHRVPAYAAAHSTALVHAQVVAVEFGAPITAAAWLALAWANDRGHRWGRFGVVALLALTLVSVLTAISRHGAAYAVADVIAGAVLCATALAASALIISIDANTHYDKPRRDGQRGPAGTNRAATPTRQAGPGSPNWNRP
ncbi:MAG: hypothetical protein ACRDLT_10495 [Solirubrobacteraceae bacterium]